MSGGITPLERDVRQCVRERHERGCAFVKTGYVAKELDENPQRIAPIMQDMVREGTLEPWRETNNATVYRIHL